MPVYDEPLAVISFPGTSYVSTYTDGYKSWVRTPGYRTIASRDLPANPYSNAHWSGRVTNLPYGSYTRKSDGFFFQGSPIGWGIGTLNALNVQFDVMCDAASRSDASILNELIIQCLVKASDSKINLAVALAEASKTADLILGTARTISSAYLAFRRGNFRKVANLLNISPKKAHKRWLEYKYGWMPLLMDVKGGAEAFAQHNLGGRPLKFTVSSSSQEEVSPVKVVNTTYSTGSVGTERWVTQQTKSHRVIMSFEVVNPNLSAAQQLGLTNPALVAWELIPFSFVFDWFISVGNYCQAVTAMQGLNLRRVSHSLKTLKNHSYSYSSTNGSDASNVYYGIALAYMLNLKGFQRTVPVVDPLAIYPPVNSKAFDWQKMITSLALLRSQSRPSNIRI